MLILAELGKSAHIPDDILDSHIMCRLLVWQYIVDIVRKKYHA